MRNFQFSDVLYRAGRTLVSSHGPQLILPHSETNRVQRSFLSRGSWLSEEFLSKMEIYLAASDRICWYAVSCGSELMKKRILLRVLVMERSNSLSLAVVTATICVLFSTPALWADITNGDFSSDLLGTWDQSGVDLEGGKAIFDEREGSTSDHVFYLEQTIDIETGLQLLSFDIMIDGVPWPQGETDHFRVFLNGGDPIHEWDSSIDPLVVPETTWSYYSEAMSDVILRFEFDFDYDTSIDATRVELDNVRLTPAPGAVLLGMLGLSVAGVKLRKRT